MFPSRFRTCLPLLKACSGWWTTFATTDCVTVVCPLVPLSYSTLEPVEDDKNKDCLWRPRLHTPPARLQSAYLSSRKEWHALFWLSNRRLRMLLMFFFLVFTVKGWLLIIFLRIPCPWYVLPAIIWQEKKWNLVCRWLLPRPGAVWAGPSFPRLGIEAGLGLSTFNSFWVFFKCLLLFILPLIFFFFQSPKEMDCQLKVFHIIPFWQNSLINKVFYNKIQVLFYYCLLWLLLSIIRRK